MLVLPAGAGQCAATPENVSVPAWFEPLLAVFADQPVETTTLTLTLAEIEALLGLPLPPSARTRSWWVDRSRHAAYRRLLAPLGWTVGEVRRRYGVQAVTFVKTDAGGEEQP